MQYPIDCILKLPYPRPEAPEKDPELARLLLPLYAGTYGEFTSAAQYSYQSIVLFRANPMIADILECLAATEKKHFDLLGKLILSLGVDPKIGTTERNRQSYWSGSNLNYNTRPDKMISDDVMTEKKSVSDYRGVLRRCKDPTATLVLERILQDEEHHVKVLIDLFRKIT